MRKPRLAIAAYDRVQAARVRWRAERAIRHMVTFDDLPTPVHDRVVVSRRRVLEGRSVLHHAPGATPIDQRITTEDLHLSILRDVLVDVYFGFAQTHDGWILEDTSIEPEGVRRKLRNGQLLRRPRIIAVDRPVANLECGPKNANFFHFWLQSLTKLLWVREPEVAELGPLILAHERVLSDWQRALLAAALPDDVTLVRFDRGTLVDAPAYVDLPGQRGHVLDADLLARLRRWSHAIPRGSDPRTRAERLYISRRAARWRRLRNESALEALLETYGFVTFVLEDLPVGDQIALFENATMIVAQHGAGLTHLLHVRPGTRLLEIQSGSPEGAPLHYRGLAASVQVEYSNLFCHAHGPMGAKEDAEVPLQDVRRWLDGELGPSDRQG